MVPGSRSTDWGFGLHRYGTFAWVWPFVLIVLSGLQKKCLEGDIGTDENDMAITHHDDLRLIKDMVRFESKLILL